MSGAGDILDQIDHALRDSTVSGDAMRWSPDPSPPPAPERPVARRRLPDMYRGMPVEDADARFYFEDGRGPLPPPDYCHPQFALMATNILHWLRTRPDVYTLVIPVPVEHVELFSVTSDVPLASVGIEFERLILRRVTIGRVDRDQNLRAEYLAAVDNHHRVLLTSEARQRRLTL